ncbi:MAG: hypothetical protein ACRDLL_14595 [Solirubrobacterales bacterium]
MRDRVAPLSGIVFVVLLIIGFFVVSGNTPDLEDSGASVVTYYADHQSREIAAAIIVAAASVFLAIFTASLRERLRSAGAGNELWATVALIGGGAAVAGFLVAVGIHVALIDGGDKHIPADAMVAINAIDNDNFFSFSLPLGIMLLGAAGATLTTGALPRWLGWVGLIIAILFFTPIGFLAFALSGVWIVIVSIVMSRQSVTA